ncbi:MAG: ABC transporter substrate-binding protein [Clostridiales bacterium]|nr:ABC transporter substrate-binding protein [Clostridiales bacterium]
MKIKRTLALTLCFVLCLSLLVSCKTETPQVSQAQETVSAPSPTTASGEDMPSAVPPPKEAEFVEDLVVLGGDKFPLIDVGNPAFNVPQSAWICNMVFNNLAKLTVDNDYAPALATSWESADMQHFNFKLRDDVYFHNGEKFKADDVAFTIDRAKESAGSMSFNYYKEVDSYEVVSDTEINITLKAVNVDFIDNVATPQACILNRKAVETDPNHGTEIGTGPWIVSELVSNEYVKMTRNDDYWGELPATKTITFRYVQELSARLIMLENGEAHIAYQLDVNDIPIVQQNPELKTIDFILNNTAYLAFNMNNPLMADLNFRMAVASAINRDDCVAITRSGYGVPVDSGTYWGYKTEFKNADIPIIPRDLEKAKEYLAKSSYNGETVELVAAMVDPIKNAQIIQANLEEIGIKCKVFETDSPGMASYTKLGNTESQMIVYSGAWTLKAITSKTYFYPDSTGNRANYNNPEVKALYDKAFITLDVAEREKIYKDIQEIVAKEIPYLGIFNMQFVISCAKGIDGIQMYPTGNHDFSYLYCLKS